MYPGLSFSSKGRELHVVAEEFKVLAHVVAVRVRCGAVGGGDDTRRFVHDAGLGKANNGEHESVRGRSGILLRQF